MPLGSQLSNNFPTSKCHKMGLQLYNGRWNNFVTFTYVGWNKKTPSETDHLFRDHLFWTGPIFPIWSPLEVLQLFPKKTARWDARKLFRFDHELEIEPSFGELSPGLGDPKKRWWDGGTVGERFLWVRMEDEILIHQKKYISWGSLKKMCFFFFVKLCFFSSFFQEYVLLNEQMNNRW